MRQLRFDEEFTADSHRTDCAYSVHVEEEETGPFREQAALFHRKLIDDGCASSLTAIKATNHMTSMLSLGNPLSTADRGLISTVDKSRAARPQQHHAPR